MIEDRFYGVVGRGAIRTKQKNHAIFSCSRVSWEVCSGARTPARRRHTSPAPASRQAGAAAAISCMPFENHTPTRTKLSPCA